MSNCNDIFITASSSFQSTKSNSIGSIESRSSPEVSCLWTALSSTSGLDCPAMQFGSAPEIYCTKIRYCSLCNQSCRGISLNANDRKITS